MTEWEREKKNEKNKIDKTLQQLFLLYYGLVCSLRSSSNIIN